MVSLGPRSSSAAKSTAYDTDIVEPLLASGRLTLNADVIADVSRRTTKSGRLLKSERGPSNTTSVAPIAIVAPTYSRAESGKARMCAGAGYDPHTALAREAEHVFGQTEPRLDTVGRWGARSFKSVEYR